MNWFSALTLRLFIGSILGFAITLAISFFVLNQAEATTNIVLVYLLLLGPLVAMLALGFFLPEWIGNHRWQAIWKPRAEGKLPVNHEEREKILFKGVNELTSVWVLPSRAKVRLEEYLMSWARTLIRDRIHDPILWEVLALCWYKVKTDRSMIQGVRSLMMEQESLDDSAFDLGLSLLTERETDVDLAILLAREGLGRDLSTIAVDRHVLLENAWLAAYAKDEELRPHLLPILTRRFLAVQRRDEVSGRIYLDAFIAGERAHELRDEMKRTADVLARTGRSPEMTANLRALAESGKDDSDDEGRVGTILRAPSKWTAPLPPRKEVKEQKRVPKKEVAPRIEEEEGDRARLQHTSGVSQAKKAPRVWFWLLIVFLVILIGGGYYYLKSTGAARQSVEPELTPLAAPLTPPGQVHSDQPYTLQIAAIQHEDAAIQRIRDLREIGVDAYYVINEKNDVRWYRIRIGRFETTREATHYADSLRAEGVIQEYYVATFEKGVIPVEAAD